MIAGGKEILACTLVRKPVSVRFYGEGEKEVVCKKGKTEQEAQDKMRDAAQKLETLGSSRFFLGAFWGI